MGKKQNKNNKKATNTTTSSKPQQSIPGRKFKKVQEEINFTKKKIQYFP